MSCGVTYLRAEWDHHEHSREDLLATMDEVPASIDIIDDSFMGLVKVAQAMLDEHYPADVFGSGPFSVDAGAQFTTKLREALAMVHADPSGQTRGDQS